jgi:hypothetical protein
MDASSKRARGGNKMLSTKIRTTIIAAVAAFSVGGAAVGPASALAESPTVWTYGPTAAQPLPAYRYDLNVTYSTRPSTPSLVYGWQTEFNLKIGADLEWAKPGRHEWEFRRQPSHPATTLVTGTERVALYNRFNGQYLIREDQTFGINLGFSATPSYEWQVANGNGLAELYNINEQGYLLLDLGIYHPGMVDLEWLHAPFSLPNGYKNPPALAGSATEGIRPVIGGSVSPTPTVSPTPVQGITTTSTSTLSAP